MLYSHEFYLVATKSNFDVRGTFQKLKRPFLKLITVNLLFFLSWSNFWQQNHRQIETQQQS